MILYESANSLKYAVELQATIFEKGFNVKLFWQLNN